MERTTSVVAQLLRRIDCRGPHGQSHRPAARDQPAHVDAHRARLMRKYGASTTPELVNKLLTA
jgi:hypothetical protein